MASPAITLLETLLQQKKFAGTLARSCERPRVGSSGLAELDERIGGGWPLGAISEIVGTRSAGRTRVVISTLTAATRQGQVVALVDTLDRFDPRTAAEAGLDLTRVLWVRGAPVTAETARPAVIDHAIRQAVRACDLIIRANGFAGGGAGSL
jgi:RecA/RadA recombinase